jgi:hypothetical protein
MDVLEHLLTTALDVLPAGLADLAYEAMALGLHVAAAVVAAVMLAASLAFAAMLQRREQLAEVAFDGLAAVREQQPPRVRAELAGVVGGPLERLAPVGEHGPDGEHDRRGLDAQLGGRGLVVREVHDQGQGARGRRGWPEDAQSHAAAKPQVGVLR